MVNLLYKPLQYLEYFKFKRADNFTTIVASIKVDLHLGEIIVIRNPNPIIPVGSYNVILEFDVKANPFQQFPDVYPFPYDVIIGIEPLISYGGSLNDPVDNIRTELRNKIKNRAKPLGKFEVTTIIFAPDGSLGGQVTTTISEEEDIVII